MGKTHFSGPIRVGTNENNMGYLVNALTLAVGPSVPSSVLEVDSSLQQRWSSWTGESADTGPWTKIPPSSQIVDIQVVSEIGFNAENYVTTATISAANHTVNCATTAGSTIMTASSNTYDGSVLQNLQGCPVSAAAGVFSDLTDTILSAPITSKIELNKPALQTHAATAVTFHTDHVVKIVGGFEAGAFGKPQIGDTLAASGYSGDYPLPATNAARRIKGRTQPFNTGGAGTVLFLVMNAACQASSTAFTLHFPSGGTVELGEDGPTYAQRDLFLDAVLPPEINSSDPVDRVNLSVGFNNSSGAGWQTGVIPPRGNSRVGKWNRDLHGGNTTSPVVIVEYSCNPADNFPGKGAFRTVIFYVDNGGVD